MKTLIQIADYYNETETVGVRVSPIELDEQDASLLGHSHYALLTAGQIKRLKARLSNGPRQVNATKQDNMGCDVEAEVYFNL